MAPLTLAKIAIRALLRNRMRTFLSVLGIVIGVAAVIAMVAMGEGSRISIKEQMTSMGSNAIIIMPNRDRRGGVQMESSEMLEEADVIAIREQATYIDGVSPMVTVGGQAIVGNNNSPTTLSGISADYLKIRNYEIEDGVMFDDEADRMAKVCVIGQSVVKNLFPEGDPIGKTLRYKSIPLKVIGTLKAKGSGDFGQDNDDVIFTPYQTVMRRFSATTNIRQIYANSIGEGYAEKATEEIMGILKERRSWTRPTDPFRVFTQEEMIQTITSTSDLISLVLTIIAGISLFVGGIGIMNIMYVSVTERTKEIGLRMAIGARGRDIMFQFLFESVIISLLGGIIGIALGIAASEVVKSVFNMPMSVSITSVVVSFAVCFVTGVFFGWYPARKASRLDPIEALRFE
ncbi:putative ABC transport system permease protein [Fibrobacter sp. UWR3]|jgi:putative ABC transport system permease protein|uniref:ABC transporter permease n=1 Tax=unclassified Fibrobacter TaxID=2634177 RepID=UPI000911C78A|nr:MULTISPECIES: ABC transporter permease [unclassified Fibrobacter]MBQ9226816.1 ABC transporter permease [Fibrobacter sp.]SHM54346.1 putative ABC transport system permease protein [Fibrobacter sp. UWR3]